ncbi:uncharacterized protein J3R85_000896 [Psidium guajava]|nr:uncharacterized protein J3R85_000896 [Psidium guajava]
MSTTTPSTPTLTTASAGPSDWLDSGQDNRRQTTRSVRPGNQAGGRAHLIRGGGCCSGGASMASFCPLSLCLFRNVAPPIRAPLEIAATGGEEGARDVSWSRDSSARKDYSRVGSEPALRARFVFTSSAQKSPQTSLYLTSPSSFSLLNWAQRSSMSSPIFDF